MRFSFIVAIAGLIILISTGVYENLPDWSVGLSLIMGGATIATAPTAVKWIREQSEYCIFGISTSVFVSDFLYQIYNVLAHNPVLRYENFMVSFPLYWIVGIIMYYLDLLEDYLYSLEESNGN